MVTYDSFEEIADDVARRGAEQWRENSIQVLRESGNRLGWNVEPVIDSFTEVHKVDEGYGFEVEHEVATIWEVGSSPHTITPDSAETLAFEGDSGETVFAQSVSHPGTPALLYIQQGQNQLVVRGGDL